MDGQVSGWTVLWIFIAVVTVIPVIFQAIRKLWNFIHEILSFKNLSVGAVGRRPYGGIPHVTLKIVFTGKQDMIVKDVAIESKLLYPSRIDGILAWIQLGIGYLTDDVVGLHNVLGDSFSAMTWIPTVTAHRIKNPYIRKPLSVIFGVFIFYYTAALLFPLFWPLLFMGPYAELRLFAGNERIRLLEEGSKVELKRPFIIKSGTENSVNISYKPSLYCRTVLLTKLSIENAQILYVRESSQSRTIRLPRNNEFAWKVIDTLRIKVSGKMRRYSVNLGNSYVKIRL